MKLKQQMQAVLIIFILLGITNDINMIKDKIVFDHISLINEVAQFMIGIALIVSASYLTYNWIKDQISNQSENWWTNENRRTNK